MISEGIERDQWKTTLSSQNAENLTAIQNVCWMINFIKFYFVFETGWYPLQTYYEEMEEKKSRIFTRVKFFNLISEIIRHRKIL